MRKATKNHSQEDDHSPDKVSNLKHSECKAEVLSTTQQRD
jgi:hypothetical protein